MTNFMSCKKGHYKKFYNFYVFSLTFPGKIMNENNEKHYYEMKVLTWFPQNLPYIFHQWSPPRRSSWSAMQSVGWFPRWSYKCTSSWWGNYWGSLEMWTHQILLYSFSSILWKEIDHKRENKKYYSRFIRHSVIYLWLIRTNVFDL